MSDTIFKEKYKKLNKAQKEAVDTIEGPVMVIAGPGTGKTTILTLRIANILRQTDTPPSGILALTFTDAGVKAMRSKLREIIGNRADEVRLHTFHGFASSVIAEFPEHFPHLSRSKQITEVESESFLREILKDKKFSKLRPLGDTDFYLQKILNGISESKKEAWGPEELRNFAEKEIERIKSDPDALSTRGATKGELKAESLKQIEKCERTILFAQVFAEYENKKREEKKIDFDDLLFELLEALKKDELLLRLLQEKFLYILVDEHQDTNDSQNLIITLLSNFFETPNIFVVGDEKQAIYRFQGASVENFLKFQKIWKEMKVISLEENYRSHQSILDATFSMIEENYKEEEHKNLRVKLKSGEKNKKPIDIVSVPDVDSADIYLVKHLEGISKKEPDSTIAVILRSNRDVDHILSLCQAYGVNVSAERGVDIFSHPVGMLYFKLLEFLVDPSKTESLAETIALGMWGLDFAKSNELIKKIRSGNVDNLEKEISGLAVLRKEVLRSGVIEYLIMAGEVSGLTTLSSLKDPLSVEVWRSIIDLGKDLAMNSQINNSSDLIKMLLDYKKSAENKVIKIGVGNTDSKIQIMTAHGSKGLEYDYVFLPYVTEESWMRRPRSSSFVFPREKDTSDEIRDSRRLYYVALTRARKHVVIIVPEVDGLGKDLTPLRFNSELSVKDVLNTTTEKVKSAPRTLIGRELSVQRKNEIVEYSKRVILEKGLSVTALNHFVNCPSEFLYKSILKVPEAPSPSSEKGIAMHKAISDVWKSKKTDLDAVQRILKDGVTSFFENSLLPKSEKEIILEELLTSVPKVAQSLLSHFKTEGVVYTEKWVDCGFVSMQNKKSIEVKLHGQMDTIIDNEKEVLVFDYKTREAMSENAIKGQTKDSDGNYFRQLVFYKMLLEESGSYKDKDVVPSLVFVKPDTKGNCKMVTLPISHDDIKKVKSEVGQLVSDVYSGEFLDKKCEDESCKFCLYKNLL